MSFYLVREVGQTRIHASFSKGSPVWLCDTPIESGLVTSADDEYLTCPVCYQAMADVYRERLSEPNAGDWVFHFYLYTGELHHLKNVRLSESDDGTVFVKGDAWAGTKHYGIHYRLERVISFLIQGKGWVEVPEPKR